jgi:agmatine/peptidylarginine deiminase
MVLATLFAPAAVFCQELEQEADPDYQMEMQERQMELEQLDAEMGFQQNLWELELEKRKIELEHMRRGHGQKEHPLLLLFVIINILVAVWVYQDIRRRNAGSGIWIVIALLAGLLGGLVYAVVRIGDNDKKKA